MSDYDDDELTYEDDDDYYDPDDDLDEDDEISKRIGGMPRSGSLPGRDRAGSAPGGSTSPFSSSSPFSKPQGSSGSSGGTAPFNRPSGGSSGSSGGTGPFNRPSGGSGGSGGSSSYSGGRPAGGSSGAPGAPRPGGGSSGSSGGTGPFNRPSGGSGSSGGSSSYSGGRPAGGSSGAPGAPRPGGGSSGSSGGTGAFNRSSGGSGSSGGSSSFSGSRPAGSASTAPFGGSERRDDRRDDKKEGGKSGGFLSGRRDKADGGKKDDKGSSGGFLGRLRGGGGDKDAGARGRSPRDKEKGGGRFSLPFGKKDKEDTGRPGSTFSSQRGGPGGPGSARGSDKEKGSGGLGRFGAMASGLTSRFRGGGQKDDKRAQTGTSPSAFGDSRAAGGGFGSRPGAPGAPGATGGPRPSALGQAKVGGDDKGRGRDRAAKGEGGGFFGRLFSRGEKAPRPERQRASRAPRVQSEGLSLDRKLDILGVGLVFASLVLFFSAISAEQAAISGILTLLGQLFGWGAIAVPLVFFAAGMWLIVRYFGDQAPTINPVKVAGLGIGFVCLLTLMQYIDSFSYTGIPPGNFDLIKLRLQYSYEVYQSGGGWIGAQIYYFLLTSVTELGGIFVLAFGFLIAVMLYTGLTASEITVFLVSIGRSMRGSMQKRAQQRRAAAALAARQAQLGATSAAGISVSRPPPAELGAGSSAALPAGTETPERDILIRRGGQALEPVGAELPVGQAAPATWPQPPVTEPAAAEGRGGLLGGLLGRGRKPEARPTAPAEGGQPGQAGKIAAAAAVGGMAGGLMGRLRRGPGQEEKAEPPPAALPEQPASPAAASLPETPAASAAASPFTSAPPPAAAETAAASAASAAPRAGEPATARIGDLLRPKPADPTPPPSRPASPFGAPAAAPFGADVDDDDEADETDETAAAAAAEPAPRTSPFGAPASPFARPTASAASMPTPAAARDDDEDEDEDDEEEEEFLRASSALKRDTLGQRPAVPPPGETPRPAPAGQGERPAPFASRMERLDAIRRGDTAPRPPGSADVAQRPAASIEEEEEETRPAAAAASGETTTSTYRPFGRPEDMLTHPSEKPARPPEPGPPVSTASAAAPPPMPSFGPTRPAAASGTPPPAMPVSTPPTSQTVRQQWKLPDYRTLLASGSEQEFDRNHLLHLARVIEETLESFGAPGRVVEVNTGPVITQFGVEPDYLKSRGGKQQRVKVSAIAQLDKDIQLALGAKSIRIEAPVPGKGYVGIEVPNEKPSLVSLRDVMESDTFKKINSPLGIALGQSVDGSPVAADLTSMPHLLIAGTTGSGKSVCVNSIIASLIVQNTPDIVKFIMVDPKRVELTGYNGIPHLIAPVVVELERIVGVLKWVTREMDERYKRFSNAGARNIEDYNKHRNPTDEPMPYIIVIIDELADLMMLAPEETERVVTRIAALARATGIHLVIATQRPSVDVVTGLIKANFPARIAFAVAGGVDSRVILDQPGAERLLGRGDMLYMSGDSPAPVRLQGVFVSDMEINNITRYWKRQSLEHPELGSKQITPDSRPLTQSFAPDTPVHSVLPRGERVKQQAFWDNLHDSTRGELRDVPEPGDNGDDNIDDELYETSVEMVRRLNKASVSLLQRRLRIGYTRAARLIDMMEERGVVGPAKDGSSKPRDVLPQR